MTKPLDISWRTIFKIAVSILLFYFLYQVKEILLWILYAFVISILFEKPIDFLSQRKIPRGIATISIYFFFTLLFIFLIYFFSKPLFAEIQSFINFFPQYFEQISPSLKALGIITFETFEELTKTVQEWLLRASKNIASAISALFGGVFAAFSIISLAIFLSFEKEGVEKLISQISIGKGEWILKIWQEAKEKISLWFGARILICIYVGVATFISLLVLKINYPLSLSVLAGILDFIPILGPILAGILIFIFAVVDSLFKGVFILILFILIQQIEANILAPLLGQKFIGLPPFVVMIALLIGGKLLGLGGAILAVPLAGIFFKVLQEIFKE
jgi:predicted PurR-regulated permease PerM